MNSVKIDELMREAKTCLNRVFGYESFRPLQEACIRAVLLKKDALLIMPTGGGKSLCYQIPALIFEGLTVVVSPLISLMQDQVNQLRALGVEAVFLNSSLTGGEYAANMSLVRSGKAKLLYVAPETLMAAAVTELLAGVSVDCLAIDEAHCISDWGHDFRPEYRQLFSVRSRFPKAVCLAMTATATPRVRGDIRATLGINGANEFVASFNRPNLHYEVLPKREPLRQLVDLLKRFPGQSGIVYCFSRRQVDSVAESLAQKGYSVRSYHAGLSSDERSKNQDLFIRDDVQIMVATIAFGMGINKPNVRFVVHYDLPKNVESYYQETGRAGRDGLPARCLLLFGYGDIHNIRFLIGQKSGENEKRVAAMHLSAMIGYAEAEVCRRLPLISYFGEEYKLERCDACDNCVRPREATFDITEAAQKFLLCASQTRERFGAMHLVDILRGSESEKITRFGHEGLAAYGAGKEFSARQWQSLVRQFIQKGLIRQDQEAYGALKITAQGAEIMKGGGRLFGFAPVDPVKAKPAKEAVKEAAQVFDERLFEILRKKRKQLSDEGNVPPYVIFSDKSLVEMCVHFPKTQEEFSRIYGVGAKKLENYGKIFTRLISEYQWLETTTL